jgi:hypothetical protein
MQDVLLLRARPACRARWSGTGEIHENRAASESRVTRKRGCYLANRIVLIGCMTPPFEESLTVRSVVRVDSSAKRSRRTPPCGSCLSMRRANREEKRPTLCWRHRRNLNHRHTAPVRDVDVGPLSTLWPARWRTSKSTGRICRYNEVSVVAVNLGLCADRTAGANGLRASHFGNDRTSAGVPSMDTRSCRIAWARDIYPSQIR